MRAYNAGIMETSIIAPQPAAAVLPDVISEEFLAALRAHDAVSAQLFGSFASGSAGPDSDIDLLVRFDRPITLFAQLRLAEALRRICGRRVDLMTDLHPAFAPYILPTLVPLPL